MPKTSSVISELWLCRRPIIKGKGNWTFPAGFIKRLEPRYCNEEPGLHLFSNGALVKNSIGLDIRSECKPDIVANAEQLPFPSNTFKWCLSDPPFSEKWGRTIWGTKRIAVGKVQSEIMRVVEPGGLIMWFHYRPFVWPKTCRTLAYIGVMAGCRNRLRLLHVLRNGLIKGEPSRWP